MRSIYLSAAHKSSGKTTISVGLAAALTRRGMQIQPFKKGPDYIDPIWLEAAAGKACYNLDFYTMTRPEIAHLFASKGAGASLAMIEGNKGLYDGMALDGSDSNAGLAEFLQVPVVLVLDATGITRGIAPLILGYQAFAEKIQIAGIILNRVAGLRHENKLRTVIEHYTDLPIIGAVARHDDLHIDERHLGLMPGNEISDVHKKITLLADAIANQVDLDAFLALAAEHPETTVAPVKPAEKSLRIGFLRDRVFGFYYADDLDKFARLGAQLIPINSLKDSRLPPLDGLFIGGGFPETAMQELSSNTELKQSIHHFIEQGGPTYAECGGLMYLSRSITWNGECHEMVGIIEGDTLMHQTPQGRGYVRLKETGLAPWGRIGSPNTELAAHEFHHSSLIHLKEGYQYAYQVVRGTGIDGKSDGLIYKNLLASYTHMRSVGENHWVERFIELARKHKNTEYRV